jgi:purine-nucleoside phosphorylase
MTDPGETIVQTLKTLSELVPAELLRPSIGIVCGSGLSGPIMGVLRDMVEVEYERLEGFARSTVKGHRSVLAFGRMGEGAVNIGVVVMLGRVRSTF